MAHRLWPLPTVELAIEAQLGGNGWIAAQLHFVWTVLLSGGLRRAAAPSRFLNFVSDLWTDAPVSGSAGRLSLGGAARAQAPVVDLGLIDCEPMIVTGLKAGGVPHGAVNILDLATVPADQMVMIGIL